MEVLMTKATRTFYRVEDFCGDTVGLYLDIETATVQASEIGMAEFGPRRLLTTTQTFAERLLDLRSMGAAFFETDVNRH